MLQPIFKKIFHYVSDTEIISCIQGTALHFVLVAAFLGTLNHFLYFLSGQSPIIALFCPVNESVWEHLKLLYFLFIRKHMGISVSASGCFTVLLLSVSGCASRNVFYCFCFLHIFRDSRPEFPDLRHPAFLFQCNIFIWNVWIYFRQDPFSSRDRTWLCSLTLVDNIIFLLCIYMFSARSSVILFSISTTTINTFPCIYN